MASPRNTETPKHGKEKATMRKFGKLLLWTIFFCAVPAVAMAESGGGSSLGPGLGAGLGGLSWSDVEPQIVAAFETLPDVAVHLHVPR